MKLLKTKLLLSVLTVAIGVSLLNSNVIAESSSISNTTVAFELNGVIEPYLLDNDDCPGGGSQNHCVYSEHGGSCDCANEKECESLDMIGF